MSIITKMRKQTAVYWELLSINRFGEKAYEDPVEINVRWEDRTEEFLDAGGERMYSQAVVYVDRDVTIGGVLLLGALDSDVDQDSPKENNSAYEIKRFDKLPTLKATEYLRTVHL